MLRLTRRRFLRLGVGGVAATVLAACRGKPAKHTPLATSPEVTVTTSEAQITVAAEPIAVDTIAVNTIVPESTPATSPRPSLELNLNTAPTYPPFDYDSDVTITAIDDFYTYTHHPQSPPEISKYRLRISGQVRNELELSIDDLMAMPVLEHMRTLECISNPVGGRLISNGVWRGVPTAHLLELAGVLPRAIELRFECADGYDTSIPVELATDPRSFLAYWMNGVPLPPKHGYPLRALWPGRYGQKQPKWITGIELIAEPHLGHWERQGWSNEALIVPNSRIDQPKKRDVVQLPNTVSGIAFANQSGVARVDVSADDGVTWHEAKLVRGPSPLAWVEWQYDWQDARPGSYVLRARVTDGDGRAQRIGNDRLLSGVKPDGTDVQHTVAVTVKRT